MTNNQAENVLTLISLLENEVSDEEYGQRNVVTLPCCALGHANRYRDRFHAIDGDGLIDFDWVTCRRVIKPTKYEGCTGGREERLKAIHRLKLELV